MRQIFDSKGNVYAEITLDDKTLAIYFNKTGYTVHMDAKVVPQLADLLKEAEFFKYL